MADFNLQIISPDRVEFDSRIESLVAPGEEGYFGILANHAPMLSTLGEGKLILRRGGGRPAQRYWITGGFLEVHKNKVTVLAREMEPFSGL